MSAKGSSSENDEHTALRGSHTEHFLPISQHNTFRERIQGKNLDNVLPHSIEAGDPYYIGDVYASPERKQPWEIDVKNMPYLKYIKDLSLSWPVVSYLASWMEVTTSPVKWKHLSKAGREKRASRARLEVIKFPKDASGEPERISINNIGELRNFMTQPTFNPHPDHSMLFILEDISRDVIELFGSTYDIDPLFWRGQISDYLWFNTRDPWVELDDLPHISRGRSFYQFRYVHPRYFKSQNSKLRATEEAGRMNVLRRLDADGINTYIVDVEGSEVCMCRSKASLWIRSNKENQKHTVGILIVDPSFKEGQPLWGQGYNLDTPPSFSSKEEQLPPLKTSLLDAVAHWTMKIGMQNINELHQQPSTFAIAILSIIAKEWLTVKEYMSTRLNQIEWELQIPDFRGNGNCYGLDVTLKRLHPFRRNLPVYRKWVSGVLEDILSNEKVPSDGHKSQPLTQLREDFLKVLNEIDAVQTRVQDMVSVVTAIISIEEAKRSAEQTSSLARLTYLAVVFVPLSFVSSFLSMTPDVNSLRGTFWLFFVLAVPLTIFALFVTNWVNIKKWWLKKSQG